ncbi:hypothetical protein JW960_06620 [candidate division KSB1 bacterium]|nr:hypothetical protein [candidate division KSB1 bacterium]
MKKRIAVVAIIMIQICAQRISFGQTDKSPIPCGHYRTIDSKILGEQRTVLIHLPTDYEVSDERFPVLYRLDGETDFFIQSVSMVEYLHAMAKKIPGYIVVAIPNTDRFRDMVTGRNYFHLFIRNELIPFIDSNYRTVDSRILCGQSTSTLFVFYSFLNDPGLFNLYVLCSFGCPNNFKDDFLNSISNSSEIKVIENRSLFFTNAKKDSYDPTGAIRHNGEMLIETLKTSIPVSNRIMYKMYDDEHHVPFPSLYDGLKWFHRSSN